MTDYQIGIVAHLDRAKMAHELSRQVTPKLVNIDDGTLGCAGNHAFVQSRLASEDGWTVVLEDDAVPLNDFHDDLDWLLSTAQTPLVGLYLGTGYPSQWQQRIQDAVNAGTSLIVSPRLIHAVGYAVAPSHKKQLAQYMSKTRRGPGMPPDDAMSVWAASAGVKVTYPNPSLIDHQDTRTVIRARGNNFSAGRNRPRRAWNTTRRLTGWDNTVTMMA